MRRIIVVALLFICVITAQAAPEWGKLRGRDVTKLSVGPRRPSPGHRIVGGWDASRHQFPYQVAVYLDGSGFCGGSLISSSVVLTAAHCADGVRQFDVHLGAHQIYEVNEPNRQSVFSDSAQLHENWGPFLMSNDIALIVLPQPVTGTGISPVRVPSRSQQNNQFVGDIARVSGWGRFSASNPNISPILKYVDLVVMSNSECASYYGGMISGSKLCTDTQGGTASTCNGDSGGPLVIYEPDGEPTEIGIVSFGSTLGCESGDPAAFTRLTSYLDWLESNAGISIRP